MEPNTEGQEPQKTPEEIIAALTAEINDLKPKAEASSQNFERLKKAEQEKKELADKLATGDTTKTFDSAKLEKAIEEKVDLRLAGHSPEEIREIEAFARGKGVSLAEAAQSPFIKNAVDALRAQKKSVDTSPAPSNNIKVFNGKPVEQIFREGTPAEKQAAFEARMKGGTKSNE